MKYKDILDTFGGDTSYADRAQAALLKWDTAAFSNVAKEYKASQQTAQQPLPNPANSQWDNVWNWNYWADTADRQDEIVSNLNAAYEQNPSQFSDWNTFAENYNYDYSWRTDKERETMWNWYNNKVWPAQPQQEQPQPEQTLPQVDYNNVNNTDYFFNQLLNWNPLQWEWAAITAAQKRYNNLKYLSSMMPDQLSSAIASWNLNPVWQDMQDLKNYAPALYAQVQAQMQQKTQLDDINTLWDWIYNWLTKTETNWKYTNYDMSPTEYAKNASIIKQYNESLYQKISWLWWDTAAYVAIVASMLQNPMIQASKNEVEDLEWEIRKIQENIYTIWDTSRSVLWSEAPEDLVSAYISQQTKQLQNQLRTAQNSLLVAQWKLNNQLTEVETMIDAIDNWIKLQQYNDKMSLSADTWTWWSSSTSYSYSSNYSYTPPTQPQDTYNYQDDSDARLKEIANNLNSLYNSNPGLFKDRTTFDNYFKYNQRSPKQKALLDAFFTQKKWVFASAVWKWRIWWVQTKQEEDNLINAIKRDLLASKVVSFDATSMKKTYWKYWVLSRWQDASHNAIQQIGWISSWDEVSKMMTHLDDTLDKALLDWFWWNESNKTALVNNIKKIWNWSTSEQQQIISDYLSQFKLDEASWRKFLSDAWIKEKNINKIIAL